MDLKETTAAAPAERVNGQQTAPADILRSPYKHTAHALVAVDGSPASRAAIFAALQIAGQTPMVISGLYIVDERLVTNPYANFQIELGVRADPDSSADLVCLFQRRGGLALRWLVEQCQAKQVPVSTEIFFGGVSELILKQAEQAQLLVLGRRGLGHLTDSEHLGRNYRAVAHRAKIPLLVGGSQQRQIKRILLAYNNSKSSNRALAWAISLQQKLGCQVIVLMVAEHDEWSKSEVMSVEEQLDQSMLHDYEVVYRTGQPVEQLVAAAAEDQADLIVMGRGDHKGWIERLVGNNVERTLRHTNLPVFVA